MTDDNKAIALENLRKLSSVLKTPLGTRTLKDAAAQATDAVLPVAKATRARKSAEPKIEAPAIILEPPSDPSNRELRLIDAGAAIALDQPTDADRAFLARQLVLRCLIPASRVQRLR